MFIKLLENTPEIYGEESRDFQLLCRLLDIYINGAIEKSSKITSNLNVEYIEEKLLPLLARKLGFTSNLYFPPKMLRNICEIFPDLIKNKGTKSSIFKAAYAVLSANQNVNILKVSLKNKDGVDIQSNDAEDKQVWALDIISDASKEETNYLKELLSFVLPAGITFTYIPEVNKTYNQTTITHLQPNELTRIRGRGAAISSVLYDVKKYNTEPKKVDWADPLPEGPNKRYSKINVAMIKRDGITSTPGLATDNITDKE